MPPGGTMKPLTPSLRGMISADSSLSSVTEGIPLWNASTMLGAERRIGEKANPTGSGLPAWMQSDVTIRLNP
jgi:hypothetical protein